MLFSEAIAAKPCLRECMDVYGLQCISGRQQWGQFGVAVFYSRANHIHTVWVRCPGMVSNTSLDHQTYSAIAQPPQITWTAHLKCDKIRAKISPHHSCQPNLNHFTNVNWRTRWEGRDGITLHFFPACRGWELDQRFIRRHPYNDLKWTKLCFGHI